MSHTSPQETSTSPPRSTSPTDEEMAAAVSTPPLSRTTSASSPRRSPGLSLDFSDLPALTQPSQPSNTLIITNLEDPSIFAAANLEAIRNAINEHAPLHSFSPLKSFHRIIAVFPTTAHALHVRQLLDGENVLGSRVRVYFGVHTKLEVEDQHLQAPKSQKLFFISPPPSPPHGWEMRNEEPPNKEVHAEDLAQALSKLHARPGADDELYKDARGNVEEERRPIRRSRSGTTTVVYHPDEHGGSPNLPAIAVEDTSEDPEPMSPMEVDSKPILHTARPPVELME